MDYAASNRIGYLGSVCRWRREATLLRDLAGRSNLTDSQRNTLLREADAPDRQAEMWLGATIAAPHMV